MLFRSLSSQSFCRLPDAEQLCWGQMGPERVEALLRELADLSKTQFGPESQEYSSQLAILGLNMLAVSLSLMISGDKRLRYVSLCGGGHSCGRSGAPMMSQVNRC